MEVLLVVIFLMWKVRRHPVNLRKVYERDLAQVMEMSKHRDDERMAVSAIFEMRGG